MDDNAQMPPMSGQFRPDAFKVSQDGGKQTQDDVALQAANASDDQAQQPVASDTSVVAAQTGAVPEPVTTHASAGPMTRHVEPPPPPRLISQPQTVSVRHESAPVAQIKAEDEAVVPQETVPQEAPVIKVLHPEVVLEPDVEKAGVKPGLDADKKMLEEEQIEPLPKVEPVQTQIAQQSEGIDMNMSLADATQSAKEEHNTKNSKAWRFREIIRELKKKFFSES